MNNLAQILEAVMLVCLVAPGPSTYARTIRAATAKSMSLSFILLIVFGYAAGITAKAITVANGGIVHWYVWAVYIFNICVVSLNIPVYFRNRKA